MNYSSDPQSPAHRIVVVALVMAIVAASLSLPSPPTFGSLSSQSQVLLSFTLSPTLLSSLKRGKVDDGGTLLLPHAAGFEPAPRAAVVGFRLPAPARPSSPALFASSPRSPPASHGW